MRTATYLTTREVQDLFKVDRSTIYRMAEDGRLPAIKVGRQWRFPADQIDPLRGAITAARPEAGDLDAILPDEAIDTLAQLLGDLMGAMVIVTDMEGRPLTEVANPCGLYQQFHDDPGVLSRCIEAWHDYGADLHLEPRFRPSHFGFLCARGFIRVGSELKGMVIVGGFAPDEWPPSGDRIRELASGLGVDERAFADHVHEVFHAEPEHLQMVLSLLPRISVLVSHMATARGELVGRIAALTARSADGTPGLGRPGTGPGRHSDEPSGEEPSARSES